ncbi:WD40 repeat domain-containing protein [Lentzea aerocolonigenes]|uniref:WD40 repeat domain-containing protein n=1 Tax=Lentzea aerocolonigenes TaxID=68170 RepID=UPI0004C4033F|nr:WD40 repeat domain-containing protein [Lentzea aerocolonigenes]
MDSHAGTQRRIAELLVAHVRQASLGWLGVNAYIRQHLPTHASNGDLLGELIKEVGFLGAAAPERLLPELPPLAAHSDQVIGGIARAYMRLGASRVGSTFVQRVVNLDLEYAGEEAGQRLDMDAYAAYLPWRLLFIEGRRSALLGRPQIGSQDLSALATSEVAASKIMATSTEDHHIQTWSTSTGEQLLDWKAHHESIRSLSLVTEPSGLRLISASADGTVRLWDPETGTQVARIATTSPVTCVTTERRDSLLVFAGGEDGALRSMTARTGTPLDEWQAHRDAVSTLTAGYIAGQPVVVSGGLDRVVNVWRTADQENLLSLTGPTGSIIAVAVGSIGERPVIASGNADESVWLWDGITGTVLYRLTEHEAGVTSLAFAVVAGVPTLASGSTDMTIRLWDCVTGACRLVLHGHLGGIRGLEFQSIDGELRLISASADRSIRVWNPVDGQSVPPAAPPIDSGATSIWLWGQEHTEQNNQSAVHAGPVRSVAFAEIHQRRVIISGAQDGWLHVRDGVTGELLEQWQGHNGGTLAVAAFTMDERTMVVSGGHDAMVRLWDADEGTQVAAFSGHARSVWGVAAGWLHGRPVLISGSRDRTVRVLDATSGQILHVLEGSRERIWGVAYDTIGDRPVIAAASTDRTIWIWDAETGDLIRRLHGHTRGSRFVCFGRLREKPVVAATSADRTIRVWDYFSGTLTTTLRGHTDGTWGIATGMFQDRPIIASASDDLTVRVWDVQTQRFLSLPQASPVYAIDIHNNHVAAGTDRHTIAFDLLPSLFDEMSG